MVEVEKHHQNLEHVHQARPETKLTFIKYYAVIEQLGGSSVLKTGGCNGMEVRILLTACAVIPQVWKRARLVSEMLWVRIPLTACAHIFQW